MVLKDVELKADIVALSRCYAEGSSLGVLKCIARDIVKVIEEIQEEEKNESTRRIKNSEA